MQLVVQRLPHLGSQHVHEVLRRRLFYAGDTSEALEEQWQQCCEYGDSTPFAVLPFASRADHRRAALSLRRTCKTLGMVRKALEALGAEEL